MGLIMKGNSLMEAKKEKEIYSLQMDLFTKENSVEMRLMGLAIISGVMEKNITETGRRTE